MTKVSVQSFYSHTTGINTVPSLNIGNSKDKYNCSYDPHLALSTKDEYDDISEF